MYLKIIQNIFVVITRVLVVVVVIIIKASDTLNSTLASKKAYRGKVHIPEKALK